ncbi:MAG TPA: SulP family inorganic anion transporter [Polyangiaceae bacterium LLY-WYZ-14_1]|nr:SulP family inorganic anion transporter [Polyangiaceae bacterium LLY-WYZ-14_1]
MTNPIRWPWSDLAQGRLREDLPRDLLAGVVVAFLAVPQGVAYAVIAGLPPAAGLYAAAAPAIVGALFRSSRQVITGPTNALSLLVGTAVGQVAAATGAEPAVIGVTLAAAVGAVQVLAGVLRLGAVVDYVSSAVVLGYVTGAGILIGIGQLHELTGTAPSAGRSLDRLFAWALDLPRADLASVALGLGSVLALLGLRRLDRRIPGPLVVMVVAIAAEGALGLGRRGMRVIADLAPVPSGLPPTSSPDPGLLPALLPVAAACTVLSLVESSAVARSLALASGQRLQMSWEFIGQGLANLVAGLTSGYPTSGSLVRSTLNQQAGARTRLAGVATGVAMLVVLLALGPVVSRTPLPVLAGLLVVVAADLVSPARIRRVLRSGRTDAWAFLTTLAGTMLFPLDQAIYLGVGISLALFLRRARLLVVRELVVDAHGHLTEVGLGAPRPETERCDFIRLIQLEGPLFFGSAGELLGALDEAAGDQRVRAIVVRLKRTQGFDVTIANAFEATAATLARQGRTLFLVGMRREQMQALERTGVRATLGDDHLFPTQDEWFAAMEDAIERALAMVDDDGHRDSCPLRRRALRRP